MLNKRKKKKEPVEKFEVGPLVDVMKLSKDMAIAIVGEPLYTALATPDGKPICIGKVTKVNHRTKTITVEFK